MHERVGPFSYAEIPAGEHRRGLAHDGPTCIECPHHTDCIYLGEGLYEGAGYALVVGTWKVGEN